MFSVLNQINRNYSSLAFVNIRQNASRLNANNENTAKTCLFQHLNHTSEKQTPGLNPWRLSRHGMLFANVIKQSVGLNNISLWNVMFLTRSLILSNQYSKRGGKSEFNSTRAVHIMLCVWFTAKTSLWHRKTITAARSEKGNGTCQRAS